LLNVYAEFARTPMLQGIANITDCPDDRSA
jgi:hypothetical protein